LQNSIRNGTAIVQEPGDLSSHAQERNLAQVGTVSSSGAWPFTPGSGMNAQFNGDPVWEIRLHEDTSECVGAIVSVIQSGVLVLDSCNGGTGVWWVSSGYSFVNRAASNHVGSPQYMCASGIRGDSVEWGPWSAGICQWAETFGS